MITAELLRYLDDERDALRSEVAELRAMPGNHLPQVERDTALIKAFTTVIDYFEAEAAARAAFWRRR